MELLLEFVVEFFLEIVIDGGMELQHNEKIPKWIRVTLAVFSIMFFAAIIIGCIVLGILLLKDTLLGGSLLIVLGVVLLLGAIWKLLKMKKQMEKLW